VLEPGTVVLRRNATLFAPAFATTMSRRLEATSVRAKRGEVGAGPSPSCLRHYAQGERKEESGATGSLWILRPPASAFAQWEKGPE